MTEQATGAELADQIRSLPYDPSFLVGYFVTFVGKIADGDYHGQPDDIARCILERMANEDQARKELPAAVFSR
jgi:hypothetical protein